MIGNDIVDLALARKESNWKRKGFLEKIFTAKEQLLISKSENPENSVWILWSMKEAAYKIYNRETGIRGYFPLRLEALNIDLQNNSIRGKIKCENKIYQTETILSSEYVYTIAVGNSDNFKFLIDIEENRIEKDSFNRPYYFNENLKENIPVSKTHHGRFQKIVSLQA